MTTGLRASDWGAQLLGVQFADGCDLLYMSPLAVPPGKPARGGVPVLFPQFANTGPLRKHGFARDMVWQVVQASAQEVVHRCDIAPLQFDDWPHAAQLELRAEWVEDGFSMALTVRNTGNTAFAWTGGLHPYWRLSDVTQLVVQGLPGVSALRVAPKGLEQLFDAEGELTLRCGEQSLRLRTWGFDEWMVWSPGEQGVLALADMPAPDWRCFVCVEPVVVSRPVLLQPGQVFIGGFSCEVL